LTGDTGQTLAEQADSPLPYEKIPFGSCVCWGIPFEVKEPVLIRQRPVDLSLEPVRSPWLVFLHTADFTFISTNSDGFTIPFHGIGQLGLHAADYVFRYADGSEERESIKRRRHIGGSFSIWGENCFEAVSHFKPRPLPGRKDDRVVNERWGWCQTQATAADEERSGLNWLWAWENPHPEKEIVGVRLEPKNGSVLVLAISAGRVSSSPIRWQSRRKALVTLPEGVEFEPALDELGLVKQIQLDMGQVISANPRPLYPSEDWAQTAANSLPEISSREILIEYTAHPEAHFHLFGNEIVSVKELEARQKQGMLQVVAPSDQKVTIRVVEKETRKSVPVKLHIHGEFGEYIAPMDRHRMPNFSLTTTTSPRATSLLLTSTSIGSPASFSSSITDPCPSCSSSRISILVLPSCTDTCMGMSRMKSMPLTVAVPAGAALFAGSAAGGKAAAPPPCCTIS